jgi:signal transduction histidine kinase
VLNAFGGAATSSVLGAPLDHALLVGATAGTITIVLFGLFGVASRSTPQASAPPASDLLGDELGPTASVSEVAMALERAVRRSVACEEVRVLLGPLPVARPGAAPIRLPLDCRGQSLGVLELGAARTGTVLTPEVLERLGTIARQAAVVLSYAVSCERIELERRQQAAAWRGEREVLVETVAAEIAHEVRYSINFFRGLFETSPGSVVLSAEQADIGREEVERLERLVSGLRRRAPHRIERRGVSVKDLCARAEGVLRDTLAGRAIALDGSADTMVRCDIDQTTQILVNLLANALEATAAGGEVGISWRSGADGLELVVWDSGAGFVGDPAALFAPWYTTKERGSGLGLAITHRLVRAHGWDVHATRLDGITSFIVNISAADLLGNGEPRGSKRAVA